MELRGEIRVLRDPAREGKGGRVEEPPLLIADQLLVLREPPGG